MSYRADAVRAALNEWKAHPQGRPDLYWREVLRPEDYPFAADWCGAFALRSLQKAGLARGVRWVIGHGFISPSHLPTVRTPEPGDIAYFDKLQHQALVVSYDPRTGMLTTIDGNQPGIAPRVRFGGATYYSIQPYVDVAEAAFPWEAITTVAAGGAVVILAHELWRRYRKAG